MARPCHYPGMIHPSSDHREPQIQPLIRALEHGLRGEWAQAHAIAQAEQGADAAWVHAWLHRIEGDEFNAGYWYRRAGRPVATGSTQAEGEAILRALSTG
jgi:hypothetical protein